MDNALIISSKEVLLIINKKEVRDQNDEIALEVYYFDFKIIKFIAPQGLQF